MSSRAVSSNREWGRRRPARRNLDIELGWFHRYPARFSTDVVDAMLTGLLRRLGRMPRLCLDPFSGTGATLAACRQLAIPSVGVELTRLGVEISTLRVQPPTQIDAAANQLLNIPMQVARDSGGRRVKVHDDLVNWLGARNSDLLSRFLGELSPGSVS